FPMFCIVNRSPESSRPSPFASEKLRVAPFGKVVGRPERGVATVSVPIVTETCTIERAGAAPCTRLTSIVVFTSDPPVLPAYRKSITGAVRSGNGTSRGPPGPARMTCTPPTYVRAALLKSPTSSRYTFHVFEGTEDGRWKSMRSSESASPSRCPTMTDSNVRKGQNSSGDQTAGSPLMVKDRRWSVVPYESPIRYEAFGSPRTSPVEGPPQTVL